MAKPTIGSARIDENGNISGGKPGDQNGGKEVSAQTGYIHPKGWVMIRARDYAVALRLAAFMKAACSNNRIGYNQNRRNTLMNEMKKLAFDLAKLGMDVETDCSALVRVCLAAAGIEVADFNTESEISRLKATGQFDIITSTDYTKKMDLWRPGDILVTKSKGHTVIVITKGDKAVIPAIPGTPTTPGMPTTPVTPPALEKGIRVVGGTVNLRTGPGAGYSSASTVKKGAVLEPIEIDDWYPVLVEGKLLWISAHPDLTEVIDMKK